MPGRAPGMTYAGVLVYAAAAGRGAGERAIGGGELGSRVRLGCRHQLTKLPIGLWRVRHQRQLVRGDTGKWNDSATLQHMPSLAKKPQGMSLDDFILRIVRNSLPLSN